MQHHHDLSSRTRAAYETSSALVEYDGKLELFEIERALINEFFRNQYPVLDLGCGAGRTTANLERLGFGVVGLDLSSRLLTAAQAHCGPGTLCNADARLLPFHSGTFRQVLFSFNGLDELHPIRDYVETLKEIHRVLAAGGILIYSGHNILGRFGRHAGSLREFVSAAIHMHRAFIALQFRGADLRHWYWRYPEPFGDVVHFSAPPAFHKHLHDLVGFETLAVRGQGNQQDGKWLTWREHHINYVVRKS